MRAVRGRQSLAKSPYFLGLAILVFAIGCLVLVRGQTAGPQRVAGLAPGDCWFRGQGVKMFVGEERCYRTLPPRRICGVWMPGLEQSLFFHDISDLSAVRSPHLEDLSWLDVVSGATGLPTTSHVMRRRVAYRLCFIGRESNYYGAYGHMGMSRTGVLLEKVQTIQEIPIPAGLNFVSPGSD